MVVEMINSSNDTRNLTLEVCPSDTTLCARLQSMEVHITKGVEYGIIKDEED